MIVGELHIWIILESAEWTSTAYMHVLLGRVIIIHFSMQVLLRYGDKEQLNKWLIPLLEGKIRSGFAMTEPKVASSDATNIECSIKR